MMQRLRKPVMAACAVCGHGKCWYRQGRRLLCQRCALEDTFAQQPLDVAGREQ